MRTRSATTKRACVGRPAEAPHRTVDEIDGQPGARQGAAGHLLPEDLVDGDAFDDRLPRLLEIGTTRSGIKRERCWMKRAISSACGEESAARI